MSTITFNDLGMATAVLDIYNATGSKINTTYTNQSTYFDCTQDYTIIFHPDKSTLINNPLGFIDWALYYIDTLWPAFAIIGGAYLFWKLITGRR